MWVKMFVFWMLAAFGVARMFHHVVAQSEIKLEHSERHKAGREVGMIVNND